jgi:hypothetical protein
VVLVLGDSALPILTRYAATALMYEKEAGWKQIPS